MKQDVASPESIEELFAQGDYVTVARTGSREHWQTYAALGLIGRTSEAVAGLVDFPKPEPRFYLAVAHWMGGEEESALKILEKNPLPQAQNLAKLIRKPRIQVLAQLPWTRYPPHDLLTAIHRDQKFKVQNISFHEDDLPNRPYADITRFYEAANPPDFYVCAMVEWHVIPPNLPRLPCPILGQTGDYDLHIQTVYPWLRIFDEILVTDQTEWQDVKRLVRNPVSTFPKTFGIDENLPLFGYKPRLIDVFHSGSLLHPYFDKTEIFQQILRIPEINPFFIDGFISKEAYFENLATSKMCVNYLRHPGATSTRALEALSMGCVALVQDGSVLELYVGEQEGLLSFKSADRDLVSTIRRVLDNWPEFEQRALRGAAIIRRDFVLPRVASQYMRFMTFLAARPRPPRQVKETGLLKQKRSILWKGWLPAPKSTRKMLLHNLAKWQPRLKSETTPNLSIDMAREVILDQAQRTLDNSYKISVKDFLKDVITLLSLIKRTIMQVLLMGRRLLPIRYNLLIGKHLMIPRVLKVYQAGLKQFPDSLVLRFDLIRGMLHLGRPQDVSYALELLEETINAPRSKWQIDVMEDVYPYDFCSSFFNYRKYFDLVTEHLMSGRPVQDDLARLILASLYYYLGHYSNSVDHFHRATQLDPDFPFYQLAYAHQLIKGGEPGDYDRAGRLLTRLAESSILFQEAFDLLKELDSQDLYTCPRMAELTAVINKAQRSLRRQEDLRSVPLQPRLAADPAAPGAKKLSQPE
ncbi:MAG: hypothetical protein AB1491_00835 [Thermodesulfobacteriota bacterium]